ncbi:hypothetical protein C5167_015827 [Papaver somniferum]|uniref:Uncharacterized protein n=1 Tax=Papaver somniferum TaxID=3469 RepID=A0A4Y7JBG1_PAPSO|nr:hypothetical protein C5167_015827 [Papaver somniferum]
MYMKCLKALTIGVGMVLFQQITGKPSVLYYAATILKGQDQKKLDVPSNDVFFKALVSSGITACSCSLCQARNWCQWFHTFTLGPSIGEFIMTHTDIEFILARRLASTCVPSRLHVYVVTVVLN